MPPMTMRSRRTAFTLVEMLVVIAIIGILTGLLMPAVQRVRESANRTHCANNIKQIGLAVRLFEDQNKYLPPSRPWDEGPSWAWLILPNLEQENLYQVWEWKKYPFFFQVPEQVVSSVVPTYFCPSRRDPSAGVNVSKPFKQRAGCTSGDSILGSPGDYAACIGSTGADFPLPLPNGSFLPNNGAFQFGNEFGRGLRLADLTDGLSYTFLVGEKHVPIHGFAEYPWDCSLYDGHNPICNVRCAGPNFPLETERKGESWAFGSYHPFLCQFVFADGSVRPIMNVINLSTLGFMAERNDGYAVSEF